MIGSASACPRILPTCWRAILSGEPRPGIGRLTGLFQGSPGSRLPRDAVVQAKCRAPCRIPRTLAFPRLRQAGPPATVRQADDLETGFIDPVPIETHLGLIGQPELLHPADVDPTLRAGQRREIGDRLPLARPGGAARQRQAPQ